MLRENNALENRKESRSVNHSIWVSQRCCLYFLREWILMYVLAFVFRMFKVAFTSFILGIWKQFLMEYCIRFVGKWKTLILLPLHPRQL